MKAFPMVTVLVPARNEADDITRALEAIGRQDYPSNRMEVLVVDGDSTDGTALVAERALARFPFDHAAVIHNPSGTTPKNLNHGLGRARGDILCRVDARTLIEPHYIRTCVEILERRADVAVVGGAQHGVARDARAAAVGVARAMNNRWGTGLSRYRRARTSGSSDTVYLGAFRTQQLRAVGGWDERLGTNQDFELNRRMAQHGTVWFEASLRSGYLPRASVREIWQQYVRFGRAKVDYWGLTGDRPQPRQWLLILAPPVVAVAGGAWAVGGGPRRVAALGVAGAASLLAVEAGGADEPEAGPAAHVVAATTIATMGAGWFVGLAGAALRRSFSR